MKVKLIDILKAKQIDILPGTAILTNSRDGHEGSVPALPVRGVEHLGEGGVDMWEHRLAPQTTGQSETAYCEHSCQYNISSL